MDEKLQSIAIVLTHAKTGGVLSLLRAVEADQRRRAGMLEHLRATGAVLEIDAVAEDAIALCGFNVAELARHLLEGNPPVNMAADVGEDRTANLLVQIYEGRLVAAGFLSAGGMTAVYGGDHLRVEALLPPEIMRGEGSPCAFHHAAPDLRARCGDQRGGIPDGPRHD